jgi:ribosomal-protein-alanine N-acetyltransferase
VSFHPVFQTSRLILRPPTLFDAPSYEKYFVNYEVIRHLSSAIPWPYPPDGIHDFLQNVVIPHLGKDRWAWGLFLRSTPNTLIGMIDLWKEGRPEHRGFWLGQEFWGEGLMTEAVDPIHEFVFRDLGWKELLFSTAGGNISSRRIKEKTGAEYIGTVPGSFVDPKYTQQEQWRLRKEDWEHHTEQST